MAKFSRLGWDPDACWHCCAGRPQSGSGSLWSLDSPAVELSNYAGIGGPTNRLGTRENHFLHNLSCPTSSLWGPLTSLCLSFFVSDQQDHAICSKVRKVRGCRSQDQSWPRYYWWQVQSRKGT